MEAMALGMKYSSGNYLNGTNNRLESLNAKLKSVYSLLEEFTEKFFFDFTSIEG